MCERESHNILYIVRDDCKWFSTMLYTWSTIGIWSVWPLLLFTYSTHICAHVKRDWVSVGRAMIVLLYLADCWSLQYFIRSI